MVVQRLFDNDDQIHHVVQTVAAHGATRAGAFLDSLPRRCIRCAALKRVLSLRL